jgi:hypothetical protein
MAIGGFPLLPRNHNRTIANLSQAMVPLCGTPF